MNAAVVHDWLATYAGSERVLEQILLTLPCVDLFTLVDTLHSPRPTVLDNSRVATSFIQNLPLAKTHFRAYLPLFPAAIERFDLSEYDLVVSSSHAVAKGVLTYPEQLHICYLQSRNLKYAYDDRPLFAARHGTVGILQDVVLSWLRTWDSVASRRPDRTIANSQYVATWHRHRHNVDCDVIYRPVDVDYFGRHFCVDKDEYYIVVSRLEPYKRVELVVDAFSASGVPLVVVGTGSQLHELSRRAGRNVTFTGYRHKEDVAALVSKAKAFIFPSVEDFGIAPVEAMACGTPVIAFARGGALETVLGLDHRTPTGAYFQEQSVESLQAAIATLEYERRRIIPEALRAHASTFGQDRFRREFKTYVKQALAEHERGATPTLPPAVV